ncbi:MULTISPECIES: GNAT family N-acetyltransferase [unclassified Bradyrhizobium]|uniref:GNAT family N-acetyltransferase n=1 Tax=unclassified Bradyrhizobium TaxID=2631580 RepID=UPI00289859AD|nr:GNAT family N-acetyltransferase [Bradyrhizobium sp. AUGA SZCCT0182]
MAEEAGEILGFAWSWVCGDLWFLAQLFVSPDHQGRSIGSELLKRTFEHAKNSGATNRALITFTFNTVSQGFTSGTAYFRAVPSIISVSRGPSIEGLPGPASVP